ncbi:hypothetical protein [Streptomyces acidiscabies]|uniref:Uncharacterized protein n=3 Tax=Streptomyces acidiscabies TaxID=42234 RepID=A0AAP6ECB1_9ACTN|nr:hypothetical protein [Streptomyces acidiscabies]MBP5941453.1 hypothetical protein [Streptomyces sp. LBUM 1476]MBZ3912823.1 hypothetical protein [Streptomyces acidiscabies]MDX2958307.1 hypothetical protein [Streptomyces acidiscabies]MDX3018674.1 hypothetical protein [Streptomyces acidiscabies]MDX3791023.1 hypothetical protein [Streptomyces acidiscabies]
MAELHTAVADAATGVILALREGDPYAVSRVLRPEDPLTPAAVRVLGADVLVPYAVSGHAADGDVPLVRQALAAYPPTAGSAVSAWSHHGLAESARTLLPGSWPAAGDPDTGWTEHEPWPRLSHQVSQLAALAVPGLAPGLEERLAGRTVDLSRGFVRAVRRRDWLQAAGVGRWLARLPGVPDSLGLAAGLVFVGRWGAADPRVVLQVEAARRLFGTGR